MDPLLEVLRASVPEDKKRYIEQDGWQEYLEHLRSLPRGGLANEKQYLESSHTRFQSTLVSLTQDSYPHFIESSEAISEFVSSFGRLKTQVAEFSHTEQFDTVDKDVAHLVAKNQASDTLATDTTKSNNPTVLLRNLDKIQDILELPSLAMACVRNGYYSEALDLAAHSRRLKLRYHNVRIINQINAEIENVIKTMSLQLVKLLRQNSKLPTLIKVVSYLRRIAPFNSMPDKLATRQLQQLFIASRLVFIRTQLKTLAPLQGQPERYAKRYVEVFREHTFATVTGFKSIYPDSTDAAATDRLLAEFLRSTVKDLVKTIDQVSKQLTDPAVRASLWLQIVYCSQSLGRVGADFWPTMHSTTDAITDEEWVEAIDKQRDIAQRLGHI